MKIQLDINSDVAMCLDSMPLIEHSKEAIKEAVRKTTLWAERCKKGTRLITEEKFPNLKGKYYLG